MLELRYVLYVPRIGSFGALSLFVGQVGLRLVRFIPNRGHAFQHSRYIDCATWARIGMGYVLLRSIREYPTLRSAWLCRITGHRKSSLACEDRY